MQDNEFEKRVQQKMDEFSLLPNKAVWAHVEARIKKEKDKRSLLIWMLGGLLLIGGAGSWWLIDGRNTKVQQGSTVSSTVDDKDIPLPNNAGSTERAKGETQDYTIKEKVPKQNQKQPSHSQEQLVGVNDTQKGKRENEIYQERLIKGKSSVPNRSAIKSLPKSKTQQESFTRKENVVNASHETEIKEERSEPLALTTASDLALHKFYKSAEMLERDSIQRAVAIKEKALQFSDKAVAGNDKVAESKENNPKQWKIGFTLSGGVSDNIEGIKVASAKSYSARDALQGNFASQGANSVIPAPQLQYKSAGSFNVGVYVKKEVSKRSGITMGLAYQYYSANSMVGKRVDTLRTVYDTALQERKTLEGFYTAGQTNSTYSTYVNKYHLVMLPVDIEVRLNKNTSKPVMFSMGISPALLLGSEALYLNRTSNIYYEDKNQFKKFMLFGQTALQLPVINTSKCNVSAGPAFQYGFNSFSKSQTNTNQHLLFTGIKTNVHFK